MAPLVHRTFGCDPAPMVQHAGHVRTDLQDAAPLPAQNQQAPVGLDARGMFRVARHFRYQEFTRWCPSPLGWSESEAPNKLLSPLSTAIHRRDVCRQEQHDSMTDP